MRHLILLGLSIVLTWFAHGQVFNPATGNTYVGTSQPGDIWQARAEAAALGGHLVTINDAAENAWLVVNFNAETIYWIGLSDELSEGTFVWDGGEPVTYTNWRPWTGEPNGGTSENHVVFWPGENGVWSDWVGDASQAPGPAFGIIELPGTCPSAPNTSLAFDGIDDRVLVPDHPDLDGFADFTIEFWFRAGTVTTAQGGLLVSKMRHNSSTANDDAYAIRIKNTGDILIQLIPAGSSTSTDLVGIAQVDDGAWHHFAVTRNGNAVVSYVDGQIDSSATMSGPLSSVDTPLSIGVGLTTSDATFPTSFLHGSMDEVRIWNIARSQAEIDAARFCALNASLAGLVGYWHFDDTSGQLIADSTGNGHDGSLGASSSPSSDDPTWVPVGAPLHVATYPGSGDDLVLLTGINAPPAGCPSVNLAGNGDILNIAFSSPTGTFDGVQPFLGAQLFPTGAPPFQPVDYPDVFLDFNPNVYYQIIEIYGLNTTPFGWAVMPYGGLNFSYMLQGLPPNFSVMIQGFVLAPSGVTGNTWFTATDGHEVRFQ